MSRSNHSPALTPLPGHGSAGIRCRAAAAHIVAHVLARFAPFFKADRAVAVGIGPIEPGERGRAELGLGDRAVLVGVGGAGHPMLAAHAATAPAWIGAAAACAA